MNRPNYMTECLAVSALVALLGCVSTSFTPVPALEARNLSQVSPSSVVVLTAFPKARFETIGEIEADISGFPSDETVLTHVRGRAASVGANAVVYKDSQQAFMSRVGRMNDTSKTASVIFAAIRLLDESPAPEKH